MGDSGWRSGGSNRRHIGVQYGKIKSLSLKKAWLKRFNINILYQVQENLKPDRNAEQELGSRFIDAIKAIRPMTTQEVICGMKNRFWGLKRITPAIILLCLVSLQPVPLHACMIVPIPDTTISDSIPVWAFEGAYATYRIAINSETSLKLLPLPDKINLDITFTVNNVNTVERSFSFSANLVGLGGFQDFAPPTNTEGSFDSPQSFPLVGASDLEGLSEGRLPEDISGYSLKSDISINVLAGTFQAYKVTEPGGGSMYIDMKSGLILKADPQTNLLLNLGLGTMTLELLTTNIPMSEPAHNNMIIYIAISAAIVIAGIVGYLLMRRRRRTLLPVASGTGARYISQTYNHAPSNEVSGTAKYCRNCGKELPAQSFFCFNCGTQTSPDKNYCRKCGQDAAPEAVFCIRCGTKLK
jgi:hypothetical protein